MSNNLVSSFNPFEKPYPDMDMDSEAQDAIEERDNGTIADCDVVDYGRRVLEGYANPTEKGVVLILNQSLLTKDQIEKHFAAILYAAGSRFAHIFGGTRHAVSH